MNENCVTGKKRAFIACGMAIPSRWQSPLIAAENRRTGEEATGGVAFSLARTSGVAATSPVTQRFSWPAPNFCWNHLCFEPSRLLGLLEAWVPFSGHVLLGNHFSCWRAMAAAHVCWCFYEERQQQNWKARNTVSIPFRMRGEKCKPTGH